MDDYKDELAGPRDKRGVSYDEMKQELLGIAEILEHYPESLKPKVFEILLGRLVGEPSIVTHIQELPTDAGQQTAPPEELKPKRKPSTPENYKLLGDLNLIGDENVPSFKKYLEDKNLKNEQEFISAAVYYLVRVAGAQDVTPDHVYTCYKEVSRRVPVSLKQTLRNTAIRMGTIDVADMNKVRTTLKGENFIEHDLPARTPEKVDS